MTPEDKYPALMAYIKGRSSKDEKTAWNMLRSDEAAAVQGDYADVAQELENAQPNYTAAQIAKGGSVYPRELQNEHLPSGANQSDFALNAL